MRDGRCIRCGSDTVHMQENGIGGLYGADVFDGRSSEKGKVVSYACTSCGFFENYLIDPAKLELIAQRWTKV